MVSIFLLQAGIPLQFHEVEILEEAKSDVVPEHDQSLLLHLQHLAADHLHDVAKMSKEC